MSTATLAIIQILQLTLNQAMPVDPNLASAQLMAANSICQQQGNVPFIDQRTMTLLPLPNSIFCQGPTSLTMRSFIAQPHGCCSPGDPPRHPSAYQSPAFGDVLSVKQLLSAPRTFNSSSELSLLSSCNDTIFSKMQCCSTQCHCSCSHSDSAE